MRDWRIDTIVSFDNLSDILEHASGYEQKCGGGSYVYWKSGLRMSDVRLTGLTGDLTAGGNESGIITSTLAAAASGAP